MLKTIAALVTPLGEGGIGVILVSGPSALKIVNKIFISKNVENLEQAQNNRLYYGAICDRDNKEIDEVIINVHKNSKGHSSEDLVEINCHGGIFLVKKILDLVVSCGAHRAEWQEFPARFVGSRMNNWPTLDSIQNESLLELPTAKTKLGSKVILGQYMGSLSIAVANILKKFEALQHPGNQTITDTDLSDRKSYISAILFDIDGLLETFSFGKALIRPQSIIIIGKPNVGKSTLINKLLGKDRVIVHDEPGTTRDPISELISIKGIPFNLIDTAGIRETDHVIEKKGIEITNELTLEADKIIVMFDNSAPIGQDDLDMLSLVCPRIKNGNSNENGSNEKDSKIATHGIRPRLIPVVSKSDIPAMINKDQVKDLLQLAGERLIGEEIIEISAVKGTGISELEDRIVSEFNNYLTYKPGFPVVFTNRQFELLVEARKRLAEIITLDIRDRENEIYAKYIKESKGMVSNCLE